MADQGTIRKVKKGSFQVSFLSKKGGQANTSPASGEILQDILDKLRSMKPGDPVDIAVEFDLVSGQPKRVRAVGGTFVPPGLVTREGSQEQGPRGHPPHRHPQAQPDTRREQSMAPRDFHNPYNFVPAPPRKTNDPDLGDHRPIDQDAFLPDRFSGSIRVCMTAVTPLLVPDTEQVEENNGHKTYQLRVDADKRPLIPASSIRGMLRSAYEAVTNSRFGRFSHAQHRDRLAFRMDAPEGLQLIPARIENGQIRLLTGTSSVRIQGKPNGPMYAAWLPRYKNGAVKYPDGNLPVHGDEVVCWVEGMRHKYFDKNFDYWRVREIVRGRDMASLGPQSAPSKDGERSQPVRPAVMKRVRGWACVTNHNIKSKHDERVFFQEATSTLGPFPLTEEHRRKWQELIENYQSIHKDDLEKRRARDQQPDQYLGSEPGQTAWSRHVYTKEDRKLNDGTLCYVRLNANRSDVDRSDVEALFPVMISRELYAASPWDLLDQTLRPAATIDELSPADRVFGWVKVDADTQSQSKDKRVAARGLLRVGPVHCTSSTTDAVEQFAAPGVPLAILSAPKPQQARFYVAQSKNGDAQQDGFPKRNAGYSSDKGLRGRKVYPHQRSLPDRHWADPTEDRTQQPNGAPAHYQEYRRPPKDGQEQRDDQNRSILGWVKPGAQFTFDLQVLNLSKVELGALLYLLTLPDEHCLRFGGGKPLGFGSVRIEIDALDVRTGKDLGARYSTWHNAASPGDPRH